ncbi:MAG: hypothetical protein WC076_13740, partial [Terrimicrobiaceae bacterium]
ATPLRAILLHFPRGSRSRSPRDDLEIRLPRFPAFIATRNTIANFTFFVHPTTTLLPQRVLFSLFYFCHAQSCLSQANGNALAERTVRAVFPCRQQRFGHSEAL